MSHRASRMMSLVVLAGTSALVGCASQVQTTREWALANGYERREIQGREYFCRRFDGTPITCARLGQLMAVRWAGAPLPSGAMSVRSSEGDSQNVGHYVSNTPLQPPHQ
ncbi:MAG: hypothetical protein IRZ28_10560 [Steroidobacteraceae bacterium]|nr:hypothetical protein [Steroidobacteraceae bacterium]